MQKMRLSSILLGISLSVFLIGILLRQYFPFCLLLNNCPEDSTKVIKFVGIDKNQRPVKFTMAVTKIDNKVLINEDVFQSASKDKNLGIMLSEQNQILAAGNNFCNDVNTDMKNISQSINSIQKYFPQEYTNLSKLEELNKRRLEFFRYCENSDQQADRKIIIVGTDENINFDKDERDISGALENGLNNLNTAALKNIGLRSNTEYQLFQLSFPYQYKNLDWQSTIIEGRDKQGNRAILDIRTLGQGYYWHLGKPDFIDTPGSLQVKKEGLPISELDQALSNHSFQTVLRVSDDIIYVGTASCEGDTSNEETMAFLRANKLLTYTENNYMPPRRPLANSYALTIGQYNKSNNCPKNKPTETAMQRFIMVIGVKKVNEGQAKQANLCEVLSSAITTHELNNPPLSGTFKIRDYSEFTFGSPNDKGNSCKLKG